MIPAEVYPLIATHLPFEQRSVFNLTTFQWLQTIHKDTIIYLEKELKVKPSALLFRRLANFINELEEVLAKEPFVRFNIAIAEHQEIVKPTIADFYLHYFFVRVHLLGNGDHYYTVSYSVDGETKVSQNEYINSREKCFHFLRVMLKLGLVIQVEGKLKESFDLLYRSILHSKIDNDVVTSTTKSD